MIQVIRNARLNQREEKKEAKEAKLRWVVTIPAICPESVQQIMSQGAYSFSFYFFIFLMLFFYDEQHWRTRALKMYVFALKRWQERWMCVEPLPLP